MCPSVGSFVQQQMEMCNIFITFQDICTKIGIHLPFDTSHELAEIKFPTFVSMSISWLISSLKKGKVGYISPFSKYFDQHC